MIHCALRHPQYLLMFTINLIDTLTPTKNVVKLKKCHQFKRRRYPSFPKSHSNRHLLFHSGVCEVYMYTLFASTFPYHQKSCHIPILYRNRFCYFRWKYKGDAAASDTHITLPVTKQDIGHIGWCGPINAMIRFIFIKTF